MDEAITPAARIGLRIRAAREAASKTQEDVALYMRSRGFQSWSRSSVAALEQGRRDLVVSELLAMPWVMAHLGAPCSLQELLDETVEADTPNNITFTGSEVSLTTTVHVDTGFTETDRKVAKRLKLAPYLVVAGSRRLWSGRRLAEERDRRLAEVEGAENLSPRSRQAKRGHITRQLVAELEDLLRRDLPRRSEKGH